METQTRLSRHNRFISAENIEYIRYIYIYIYIYIYTYINVFLFIFFYKHCIK